MAVLVTPKLIRSSAKESLAQAKKKVYSPCQNCKKIVGYYEYVEQFKLFDSTVGPILAHGSEYGVMK